jgi:hypothetical protein
VLSLLAAYGPWSASSVALSSQMGRLESLLMQNSALVDGVIQDGLDKAPLEDRRELSSIISYICQWHGTEPFSVWLEDSALAAVDTTKRYGKSDNVATLMGFEYISSWQKGELPFERFSVDRKLMRNLSVTGYDYLIEFRFSDGSDSVLFFTLDDRVLSVQCDLDSMNLTLSAGPDSSTIDVSAEVMMASRLAELSRSRFTEEFTPDELTFVMEVPGLQAKVL